ncbi:MAG: hypothetical protein ACE5KX_07355 [Acidimicrobiia bacterium]
MPHAAYLRVYVPEEQTEQFTEHVVDLWDGRRVLTISDFGLWDESPRNDAFLAEWSGRRFVCPRYPRLRMLEGVLAFRDAYPGATAAVLVPESTARIAVAELEDLQSRSPGARSHIITAPSYVPLRWFAAFDPEERQLVEAPAGRSISYRTLRRRASERLERAVGILVDAGFDDVIIDEVRGLVRWLAGFPEDALVELDYGGVAELFSEGDLILDESAADVWASLEALEAGDLEDAGEHYALAAGRWAPAQALAYSN